MNPDAAEALSLYPPSARPVAEPTPLGNAGGLSGSRLWRYEAPRGRLVLRRWPEGADRGHLERVHRWIGRAEALGVVPVPIAGRDGRTLQVVAGSLWEVGPWRPGSAAIESPTVAQVRAAFATLAAFHRAMGEVTPGATSPGIASRVAEIESLLSRDLAAWRSAVDREPDAEVRRLASEWLDGTSRIAPRRLGELRPWAARAVAVQPVLRDARPDHFLFEGERLTGLIDYGAMGIDAISADLARLMGEWLGDRPDLRGEALAAYDTVRPRGEAESALIEPFERAADLLIGARWVRWGPVERRRFDDPLAVARGLRRALDRLHRAEGGAVPEFFMDRRLGTGKIARGEPSRAGDPSDAEVGHR